jgi:hypothetical protein
MTTLVARHPKYLPLNADCSLLKQCNSGQKPDENLLHHSCGIVIFAT